MILNLIALPSHSAEVDPDLRSEEIKKYLRVRLSQSRHKKETHNSNKNIQLRIFGDLNLFTSPGVIVGLNNLSPGYGYGGEIGIPLSSRFSVVLRIENVFKTLIVNDHSTSRVFQVNLGSLPIMAGLQYVFYEGNHLSLEVGALGGMAVEAEVQAMVTSAASPSSTLVLFTGSYLTFLGKVNANWKFSRLFSVFAEGGYRVLNTTQFTNPNITGSGTDILQQSFSLNLGGPVVGGGLVFNF